MAEAGARVVVNDLGGGVAGDGVSTGPAEQVVAEIRDAGGVAIPNGENVADFGGAERLVQAAVEEFGRLDILVNNAGILRDRMLVNMGEDEWDAVVAVHLKGHFAPLRHAASHWRGRSKGGEDVRARVINTSSPSGLFGNVGQANYGAAKAGIVALSVIAAEELGRYGVTVNCLAPNASTRMTVGAFDLDGIDESELEPSHVAAVAVALAQDGAQHITGQVFHIWGGAVNVLQGWQAGELLVSPGGWAADGLLAELLARFPRGLTPPSMMESIRAAGGAGFDTAK
jgi:NAD(P)-dependent dehydrogenase (short-subunit alcohol dehydrogenase family)